MRLFFLCVVACLVSLLVPGARRAAADGPSTTDEVRALRETVQKQAKEIELLRAQVEALTRKQGAPRTSSVAAPVTQPATAVAVTPAVAKAIKSVLFIRDTSSNDIRAMDDDILRSIEQLTPDQKFNIFLHGSNGVTTLAPGYFLAATPENQRRAKSFLNTWSGGSAHLEEALRSAINYKPDVIWVVGIGDAKDPASVLKAIKAANTTHIPINTTIKYSRTGEADHFHWQLAKDSGGVCVNSKGNPADEPVVPVTIAPAAPVQPTSRPTILKVN